MIRRLGLSTNMDPYEMWDKRSLRQVLDLAQSYNELNNTESEQTTTKTKSDAHLQGDSERRGKGKHRNAVVPDWYVIPKGAKILDVDKMDMSDL